MVLAQLCFAAMNVCTRLGAAHLPWAEIAAARFFIARSSRSDGGTGHLPGDGLSRHLATQHLRTFAAIGSFTPAVHPDRPGRRRDATRPRRSSRPLRPVAGERVAGISAAWRWHSQDRGPALVQVARRWRWTRPSAPSTRSDDQPEDRPGESHEAVVLHFSLTACASMVALALPAWTWPDLESGLYLLGAGLGGGGAQLAMTRAYSLHRAAPVTALSNLGIVFTYLLALPVFPARPAGWQVAGSLLVIAATVLVSASTRRSR
jgi:uncharacterized membrane protein